MWEEVILSEHKVDDFFDSIKKKLESTINLYPDRPEETIDSIIKACWLTASGFPCSPHKAMRQDLAPLNAKQIRLFRQLIQKRIHNIPLAHITGRQNFLGVELLSDSRALIPRKETELLGQKALELSLYIAAYKEQVKVMDICCGAGNLGLTLAYLNHQCRVHATDLSHDAVALTTDNINFLNLHRQAEAQQGNMFSAFHKKNHINSADLIICNPPYISSAKVAQMRSDIKCHEPALAFDGGVFGTNIIHRFLQEAPRYLGKNGWIIFEVGVGMGEFLLLLCKRSKLYTEIESVSDVCGNIRVILAKKNSN